jgi:hypothetical protein
MRGGLKVKVEAHRGAVPLDGEVAEELAVGLQPCRRLEEIDA